MNRSTRLRSVVTKALLLLMGFVARVAAQTTFDVPFTYQIGGTVPASAEYNVFSPTPVTLTLHTDSATWLTAVLSSQTTPSVLSLSVNPSGLAVGTYTSAVVVESSVGSLTWNVALSVTAAATGPLTLSSSTFTFSAPVGGSLPPSKTLIVTAQSTTSAVAQASEQSCTTSSWLSLSPTGSFTASTSNTTFTISVNQAGIAAGTTCSGTITFTAGSVTKTASVTLNVTSLSTGALTLSSTALSFTAIAGSAAPSSQTLTVTAQSSTSATAQSTEQTCTSLNWLILTPTGTFTAGTAGSDFAVSVNPAGLSAGATCSGTVSFTAGSVTQSATITLTISAPPITGLIVSATGFTFSAIAGAAAPTPMTLSVSSSTLVSATAQVSEQGCTFRNWLTISPIGAFTAGPTSTVFTVAVDQTGLVAGSTCTGTITMVAATGTQTIPVLLNVIAVGGSALTVSPSSLAFTAAAGGTAPAAQSLTVTAQYDTSATAQALKQSCGTNNWLSLTPAGSFTATSAGATLIVSVDITGIAAGTNCTGSILLGSAAGTRSIPVTLNVTAGTQVQLTASPTSFTFTAAAGAGAATAQTLTLTAAIDTSATVQAVGQTCTSGNWLTVSPSGTTTIGAVGKTFTVSVDQTGLIAGTICSGSIVAVSNAGSQTLNVTMFVTTSTGGNLTLSATPGTLTFAKGADDPPPVAQIVSVTGAGAPGTFAVSTGSADWLHVSPQCTLAAPCNVPNAGALNLAVTVDAAGLNAGSYVGSINITGTGQTTGSIGITVSFTITAPQPVITMVTNAASYLSGPVSPGEMIAIAGTAANPIGPATAVALNDATCPSPCKTVPTSMGGVQVVFYPGGIAAPLIYASNTQVNCVVPYEVRGAASVQVQVIYLGQKSNVQTLQYSPTQPGIFTALGKGTGLATVQQYDPGGAHQGQNSSSNPAKAGWHITFYVTGEGMIPSPAVTGLVTAGSNVIPLLGPPTVLIDGLPAEVTYFAEAAGLVSGIMQVNAVVPASVHNGQAVPLSLTMNGVSSQPGIVIYIR